MPSAIQQIVDAYVRLKNRGALEDLRAHRQRLAHDLRARNGFDFSVPAGQIDDEIAAIEAGLERLNRVHSRREQPNVWMIDQAGGASTIARRSFQLRPDSPQQATDMRDVSKLKFIGSSFCTQYQSDAKFYVDEAHASGLRHLVVVYEKGDPDFLAAIPAEWTEQDVQDLIFWPMKDPNAPYPAWEVPARAFGSDMLYEFWKGGPPPDGRLGLNVTP